MQRTARRRHFLALLALFCGYLAAVQLSAQTLSLPPRPAQGPEGSAFARQIAGLGRAEREEAILAQVVSGNVPDFLRRLCAVQVTNALAGRADTATFYVTPDYLAVGSDRDYFLAPLSPNTAQRVADALGCALPTRLMVNAIYAATEVKLPPAPIPPSAAMTTVPVFSQHNATVAAQRAAQLQAHPLGALVAGHKKDVVISARLAAAPDKVAIYGWHQTNGAVIQPLYVGHSAAWVDYSQCTRLVQRRLLVDGQPRTLEEVLANPALAGLLSDEGVITNPRYPTNALAAAAERASATQTNDVQDDDAVSLLNGKTFVSAAGGTWGKSHEMQRDLAEEFRFVCRTNGGFERCSALNGRVQFLLKENPEKEISHTVQVERNGFIHALVAGTPNEGRGYEYFGARAYSRWLR